MGNCLKTQLKEVVNNSNLEKFGTLSFSITSGSSELSTDFFVIAPGAKLETNGGTFTVGSDPTVRTSYDLPSGGQTIHLTNNTYKGTISKYDIRTLRIGFANKNTNIEFSPLSYTNHLVDLYVYGINYHFDLNALVNSIGENFQFRDSYLSGSLSSLPVSLSTLDFINCTGENLKVADLSHLVNLTDIKGASSTITGNISSLGSLKKCASFALNSTSVMGELNDLITALGTDRPAGAPATVTFNFTNTGCTYNGEAIAEVITINF